MNQEKKSYVMLVSSMLIFGTIGIFRRYIPLSSALIACLRGLIGSLVLLIYIKIKKKNFIHHIGIKKVLLLGLIGAMIGINWMLLFEAYNYTTVAIATLCYYMQPTIVILLSPLCFQEKLSVKKMICVIGSVIGMALVSGITGGTSINIKGILCGLGAALLYALVIIMNKKVVIEDSYEKTIIQLMSAAIILIPYLLLTENFTDIHLNTLSILMILVVGIIHTGLAYALYFDSMNHLKAQSIALMSYIDPVSALILSALILHETLTILGMIGAILILGCAIISETSN